MSLTAVGGHGTHRAGPLPLGATYDGAGTNFSLFSEVADAGRAVPDRQGRHRGRGSTSTRSTATSGTPTCPPSPRAALRLPGPRPVGPGCRSSLRSEQAAARPVRQVVPRRLRLHPGAVLLRPGSRRPDHRRPAPADGRLARPHHDQRRDQPVLRLGLRPRAAHAVPRDGDLRGARQGHDRRRIPASPRNCAAPTPGWPTRRSSTTSSRSTSPRSS